MLLVSTYDWCTMFKINPVHALVSLLLVVLLGSTGWLYHSRKALAAEKRQLLREVQTAQVAREGIEAALVFQTQESARLEAARALAEDSLRLSLEQEPAWASQPVPAAVQKALQQ